MGLGIFGHPRLCTVEALKRIAVCICLHLSVSLDTSERAERGKNGSFRMSEGLKHVSFAGLDILCKHTVEHTL